jgi:predicted metalloendopeptidase
MDEGRIESLGISPLNAELEQIARIQDSRDLPAAFARAGRAGLRLPFSVTVGADQRNSEQYAVQISQSGLGMPDRDYYPAVRRKVRRDAQGLHDLYGEAVRACESARP